MFGYVIANQKALSQEELLRYRSLYCGLCRTLAKRHGELWRITLTYDMTFLILLLSSLYKQKGEEGMERCLIHPIKSHQYACSEITDYAADMNIALVYNKCLDDWQDDKSLFGLLEAKLLRDRYKEIEKQYPRQCSVMKASLERLSELERSGETNADLPAALFGKLMGEIFVPYEDQWAERLRALGFSLGKFIYILDAAVDLSEDIRRERYNPLVSTGITDFKPFLEMLMGDFAIQLEELPLEQDIEIIRSIIYSGIWTRYEMAMNKKKKQ